MGWARDSSRRGIACLCKRATLARATFPERIGTGVPRQRGVDRDTRETCAAHGEVAQIAPR